MLRHTLAAIGMACSLAGCGTTIKTYPVPPSTYHSAQQFGDIRYALQSANQRLDLDIPEGSKPAPLVILVHGGFWQSGDKSAPEVDATAELKKNGYAVAKVNYRLVSEAMWPAAVQDVKAAVRWLRAHAAGYHLDPGRFAIWGASAGGYLAAAVGVSGDRKTLFDAPDLGNANTSSAVQAVIVWSAPVDFLSLDAQLKGAGCGALLQGHGRADSPESRWLGGPLAAVKGRAEKADLLGYIPKAHKLPPFQIAHGTVDCTVPPAQSKALNASLKDHGGESALTLLKGESQINAKFNKAQIPPGLAFLDNVLA